MTTVWRWIVVCVVAIHGLIHVLGVVQGFGWTHVEQLRLPSSAGTGVAWLVAALLVLGAAVLLAIRAPYWWLVAAVAAVASQAVILTSWSDAKAGTAANVVLLLAAGYGYAAHGPSSLSARYHRAMRAALDRPVRERTVTDADLVHLPDPVAGYVRRSGAVGQPGVVNLNAVIHGRIRSGPTSPWMPFTGEQFNLYGADPCRLFHIRASLFGVPIDVLHVFANGQATMRGKVCSLVPIVDAAGPDMDRAETVTVFNDLCVLAPAALVDAPVDWQPLDEHHVRATYTLGATRISAVLVFDDSQGLVDFVSDDRMRSAGGGRTFVRQRWSTPLRAMRAFGTRRVAASGRARWHAPEPEGEFTYLEYALDRITYNTGIQGDGSSGHGTGRRTAEPVGGAP